MTELKIGRVYLRSYTNPVHWKVYRIARSKKTGRLREECIGWCRDLTHSLDVALNYVIADADVQTIAELRELINNFKQMAKDAVG